jgi:hypothetical protein
MNILFQIFVFSFLLLVGFAPAHAETLSNYEKKVTEHFISHVGYSISHSGYTNMPENDQLIIANKKKNFDSIFIEKGLYAAHIFWITELSALLQPLNSDESWDYVAKISEHQYNELIRLLGQAQARTQKSGEMMDNGRRTVNEYYFRPLESRHLDYSLGQIEEILTKNYDKFSKRTWDWITMIGIDNLNEINPPINSITRMQSAIAAADAKAPAAMAAADAKVPAAMAAADAEVAAAIAAADAKVAAAMAAADAKVAAAMAKSRLSTILACILGELSEKKCSEVNEKLDSK